MKELLIGNTGELFVSQRKRNFTGVPSRKNPGKFDSKMVLKIKTAKTTFWQGKCLLPVKTKEYKGGNIK